MSQTQPQQDRIDEIMEQASQALVARDYFACERLCVDALRKAHAAQDYDRMARVLLPLQEARRQKRDMAIDAGRVRLVEGPLPEGRGVSAGCYLIGPPRVGMDGRLLREAADERRVPVLVVVREPTTRDGLWPLVAVGPATVRARVQPPSHPSSSPSTTLSNPANSGTQLSSKDTPTPERPASAPGRGRKGKASDPSLPSPAWFMAANEALGDAAIDQVSADSPAALRVDHLLLRLEVLPDHEKLHQRLGEACRAAAHEPPPKRRPADGQLDEDDR